MNLAISAYIENYAEIVAKVSQQRGSNIIINKK